MEKGSDKLNKNDKKSKNRSGQYGKPLLSGILRAVLVSLLVLLQVAFVVSISLALTKYTVYVYLLFEVGSFFLIMYFL